MALTQGLIGGYTLGQKQKEYEEKKQKEAKLGELTTQYFGGDTSVYPEIVGLEPQRAVQMEQLRQLQIQKQREDLTMASKFAKTVLNAGEKERPQVYRATLNLANKYGIDTTELPNMYSPEIDPFLQSLVDFTGKGEGIQYGKIPEGYMLDERTKTLTKLSGYEQPEAREKILSRAENLRKEYMKASSNFLDYKNNYSNILSSSKQPSAAGDVSLLYSYMKMIDPKSTVREGEFATAEGAGSVPERVRQAYNKAREGKLLTDTMRSDFVNRANLIYESQSSNQRNLEKQYRNIATKQELPIEETILDVFSMPSLQQPTPLQTVTREQAIEELKRRGKL